MRPFEQVVTEHGPTVLRVCRAVVGPHDAEDAWSETFLSALRAYPDLPADANVEAWLVTIAHRKAIDVGRAAARRPAPGRRRCPTRRAPRPSRRTATPTCGAALQRAAHHSARRWPTTTSPGCRSRRSPSCSATPPTPRAGPRPTASRPCASIYRRRTNDETDDASEHLRGAARRRRRHAGPAARPARTRARQTGRSCSTSPTARWTPRSGTLLLAATTVGLVRVAFDVEDHDAVLAGSSPTR